MDLEKRNYDAYDEIEHEKLLEEKMKTDLEYEKTHETFLYKLTKLNPIDPINDIYT